MLLDEARTRVLGGTLCNVGCAINFSTIEIAVVLMADEHGLTRGWAMSLLDAAVFGGCIVGMLAYGVAGDRYGCVASLRATAGVALFGVACSSLAPLTSAAEAISFLTAARFVLGVGLGGCYPLAAGLAYEGQRQGRAAEMAVAAANFGQPCGVLALCFSPRGHVSDESRRRRGRDLGRP